MSDFKAIIFDLDGTAIPNIPNGMPSQRLIDVVKKAQGSMRLCPATGRPMTNATAIIEKLHIVDPCIISGGTQIIDPVSRKVLWQEMIRKEDVRSVLEVCAPYSYEILFRDELLGHGMTAKDRSAEDSVNVVYVMKVLPDDAEKIVEALSRIAGITASKVPSWTGGYIDIHITNSKATKEYAIEVLLNILGVSKEETIGVGDGDNDIHLFKSVGLSIAMGNATKTLKNQADKVAASVDEDGLATVIEEYSRRA